VAEEDQVLQLQAQEILAKVVLVEVVEVEDIFQHLIQKVPVEHTVEVHINQIH
jgi:hypothetical protein